MEPANPISSFRAVIEEPKKAIGFGIINAEKQNNEKNAFEAWENTEIGSTAGVLRGAVEVLNSIEKPLSLDIINTIRKQYFVDNKPKYGNFKDLNDLGDHGSGTKSPNEKEIKFERHELIKKFIYYINNLKPFQGESLSSEIIIKNLKSILSNPDTIDELRDFYPYDYIDSYLVGVKKKTASIYINTLITAYEENEKNLDNIIMLVCGLARMHPYRDFNCRTFCVLILNRELIKHNFSPVILEDPNVFEYSSLEELKKCIEKGKENFQKLKDSGKIHKQNSTYWENIDKHNPDFTLIKEEYKDIIEGKYLSHLIKKN